MRMTSGRSIHGQYSQSVPSALSANACYLLLAAAIGLTALIYWPGLSGSFLFDDFPNLEQLGARGPIESLELLRAYLASGSSGPTGRPLALLSFLIDASDWPADPWPFKRTNLIVHLAVGLVIFAAARGLLQAMGRPARDAAFIGALTAMFWLINPFLVSTTLYAVQRMTQLAALFVLAGIWCYLKGLGLLASRPKLGYTVISVGIPVFTLLAVFSKENGALLPVLLLIVHAALRNTGSTRGPSRLWVTVFLALPSVLLLGYLLMRIPGAEHSFASRDFTLTERLLSQPRFLWDYLYHLLVPHIQTQGLYHDGRAVSTSLLEPWTTLPALLGLVGLAVAAWMVRAKWPLFSLAVFFYLAGHLLESTTIPLELYFEHRSYLPAAFLFLPLAAAAHDAARRGRRRGLVIAVIGTLAAAYALATWQRAALWGDEDRLLLVWAETNPDSDRAQVSAAQIWLRNDRPDNALATLAAAAERMPDSVLININTLAFRAELGLLSVAELESTADRIRAARFDAQGLVGLELLVGILNARAPLPEHARVVGGLLEAVRSNPDGTTAIVRKKTTYLQGVLLAGQGQVDAAMPFLLSAFDLYRSVDSGMRMVADLAGFGHYEQALELLSLTEALLNTQGAANEPFSEPRYRSEIERLRDVLRDDIAVRDARQDGAESR